MKRDLLYWLFELFNALVMVVALVAVLFVGLMFMGLATPDRPRPFTTHTYPKE